MQISNKKNRRGFTLIELLVVILILAILAALIVPRLIGRTDDAKRARAMADIKTLEDALTQFRMDTDRYPSDEEGLDALLSRPSDVNVWNGPYVPRLSADPWQNPYIYRNLGNDQIEVLSYGGDGAEGGEGNAADITTQPAGEEASQ